MPRGSIKGRVVGEDGQPLAGARVYALKKRGGGYEQNSTAVTGPDGSFKLENLEAAPYGVSAYAPGYFDAFSLEYERGARVYYRLGDAVSIRAVRGGVITGRVTDARGEPAAGVRVNLVRVRTLEGSPVREVNRLMRTLERTTDDRGVYRSYGLLPGVYVVSAAGRYASVMNFYGSSAHTDEAPTFYPSTTRDAAAEVTVRAGEEVGAVDVRLRSERGRAVSGTVAGVTDAAHAELATVINLISSDSTEYAGQVYIYGRAESEGFSLDGLSDGDYDLVAARYSTKEWQRVAVSTRRVQIRGADVTGLRLTFAPLASLSGRMIFETPPATETKTPASVTKPPTVNEAKPTTTDESKASSVDEAREKGACRGTAAALWSGAALVARREPFAGQYLPANEPLTLDTAPDAKGEFAMRGLVAGTYRLEFNLSEGYFVTGVRRGQRAPETAATGASVVRLQQGEQVSDLTVAAAYGAASVAGRVSFGECEGCSPARVRLYLVPQERERADDALRYSEATVERKNREGEFSFAGLAPGRYILVALPEPVRKRGAPEQSAFADADSRARLRREAESRGARITLAPCEHSEGVAVTYAPL
jgi:5-hydroxyisourate hydrolase-like protein (transthyretin family)